MTPEQKKAARAVTLLTHQVRLTRAAHYRLADTLLTRAHTGPARFSEFPPRHREQLCSEVTAALTYIALITSP